MGALDWLLLWAAVISDSKTAATQPPGFLEGGERLPLSPLLADRAYRTHPYPGVESGLGTWQSPLLCWALRCIVKVWEGRGEGRGEKEEEDEEGCVCPQTLEARPQLGEQDLQTARPVASAHCFVTWTVTSVFSMKQCWPRGPPHILL